MREIYIILGWVGWIWLGVVAVLISLGLWVQHVRRQRRVQRGFVEVVANDEKQS